MAVIVYDDLEKALDFLVSLNSDLSGIQEKIKYVADVLKNNTLPNLADQGLDTIKDTDFSYKTTGKSYDSYFNKFMNILEDKVYDFSDSVDVTKRYFSILGKILDELDQDIYNLKTR